MNKVIGYVSTKDLADMREEDVRCLDVINIAFAKIQQSCVVWEAAGCKDAIKRIYNLHPEIKILLSVGGWGADGFSQAALTEEGRERLAKSAVSLTEEYGLDGIDIDWEYPGTSLAGIGSHPQDRDNFTLLLKKLRQNLDSTGFRRLLTIAAGGDTYFILQTDMKKAAKYLDYVQLMTYDLQGGFQKITGHHSSLYLGRKNLFDVCVDKAVKAFMGAGVPADKLVVGVPFYSRQWKGVKGGGCGLGLEAETVGKYGPDYGSLLEGYVDKNGYQRYWDEEARVPYLFDGSSFISYDDRESIACKIAYVKEKKLGGIMFWEYKCDSTGTLTCFIRQEMEKQTQEHGSVLKGAL